jgi:hypothetical protein
MNFAPQHLGPADALAALETRSCGYSRNDQSMPVESQLARISHSVEAHRGANQRKFFCEKDFAMIQGAPRCRQSVAQSGLILEGWKGGLWKQPLMAAW